MKYSLLSVQPEVADYRESGGNLQKIDDVCKEKNQDDQHDDP